MNIVRFIGAMLLLANFALSEHNGTTDNRVINITSSAEETIVPIARQIIRKIGLDNLPVTNTTVGFEQWNAFVKVQLTDGLIKGISRFYRDGDFTVQFEGEHIILTAPVRVKNLRAEFTYDYDSTIWHQKGQVDATIDYVRAVAVIKYNIPSFQLVDAKFSVVDLGIILVDLRKNMLTDWYMDVVVDVAIEFIQPKIVKACEKQITETVMDRLNIYNKLIESNIKSLPKHISNLVEMMIPRAMEYLKNANLKLDLS